MKTLKSIPKFKSEDEERAFWADHSAVDYLDLSQVKRVTFSRLKPSSKSISLRLPEMLLNDIKVAANKEDVPYQSLIKLLLAQGLSQFRKQHA